jgi:hypothetical protein
MDEEMVRIRDMRTRIMSGLLAQVQEQLDILSVLPLCDSEKVELEAVGEFVEMAQDRIDMVGK